VQKYNKILYNKTTCPTFNFEGIDILHHSCPTSYKLLNDPSKIVGLHITIHIKQNMLVELCAGNCATYNGLVNGANGIFKISTSFHNKAIIWISFPNPKT
jgi:ribonuclease HIII